MTKLDPDGDRKRREHRKTGKSAIRPRIFSNSSLDFFISFLILKRSERTWRQNYLGHLFKKSV